MTNAKTILIAEDDPFISKVYKVKFSKSNYNVLTAANGEEALAKLKKNKLDLILMDLIMPIKSGFDVLEEMQKDPSHADIPVIVLTNLGQDSDVEKAKKLGAKDFVIKSNATIEEIIKKVDKYLA